MFHRSLSDPAVVSSLLVLSYARLHFKLQLLDLQIIRKGKRLFNPMWIFFTTDMITANVTIVITKGIYSKSLEELKM